MAGSTRAHGVEAAVHVERDDLVELLRRGLHAGLADRAGAAGDVDQDVDARRTRRWRLPRPARIASASVRSQGTTIASAPSALASSATGSIAAVSRPTSASLQPSAANALRDRGAHALGRAGDHGDPRL